MEKRAQIQLSFGVIFSIIIIVVTLAVAGYIIAQFVGLSASVSCKLYHADLQERIDKAWNAQGNTRDVFEDSTPAKTEIVCFGSVNQTLTESKYIEEQADIADRARSGSNMFFYPTSACESDGFSFKLNHIKTDGFFCIDVVKGKSIVKIDKGSFETLVKISK